MTRTNETGIWSGGTKWKNANPQGDNFASHTQRLASYYATNSIATSQFVKDFALVFAGIPNNVSSGVTIWNTFTSRPLKSLHESNDGLAPQYLDSVIKTQSQSHHYAGMFFVGYYAMPLEEFANYALNGVTRPSFWPKLPVEYNPGDVALGTTAGFDGLTFSSLSLKPSDLSTMILNLENQSLIKWGSENRPH